MSKWPDHAHSGVAPTRRRGLRRAIAIAAALTLATVGSVTATEAPAAFAVDYPSWDDVVRARQSEGATQTEIVRIQGLLAALRTEVERTEAEAAAKGLAYQEADLKYQEGAIKAGELASQAAAAKDLAARSKQQAGEIVAQQYRSGSGDATTNLFVNAADADDLLYSYGMADKLTEQTAGIYEKALQDQNNAQALTDQADIAKGLLEILKVEAEAALVAAQETVAAAEAAVAQQESKQAELNAQLAVLTERRAATEVDFRKGEEVRAAIAAEKERLRLLALAAAGPRPPTGGGGGGGVVGQSGWAKPASGGITSGYGWRYHPKDGDWRLHSGTDIGAGCGAPIYAAHAGTVVYSGPLGTYGNWILIRNGDGIETGYAHIINGGLLVGRGAQVAAGQHIARVGSTGGSTGCHLHYEVRVGGGAVDAAVFMRNQGITLG